MSVNEAHCVKELMSMLISNQNFHIFKMSWAEIWTCGLIEDKQQLFTLNQRHLILTTEFILTSAIAPQAGSPLRCIWVLSDYITPVKEKKQAQSPHHTLGGKFLELSSLPLIILPPPPTLSHTHTCLLQHRVILKTFLSFIVIVKKSQKNV